MTEATTQPISIEALEQAVRDIESEERPPAVFQPPLSDQIPKQSSSPLALKEFVNPEQLKTDVQFDLNDLDNAIRQHAALFVHYADLARLARRQFERMKATAEVLESKLYAIHREAMAAEGKKPTEGAIDAAVKTDPRWFATQQKMIDSRAIYDLASDAREAFSQRKDMLIQVSVDRRKEREGELRVNTIREAVDAERTNVLAHLAQQSRAAQPI